jgi:hypothetical protein
MVADRSRRVRSDDNIPFVILYPPIYNWLGRDYCFLFLAISSNVEAVVIIIVKDKQCRTATASEAAEAPPSNTETSRILNEMAKR